MAGLRWPIPGHHTSQRFAGQHQFESAGFLETDAVGPRRARTRPFPGAVPFTHLHGAIDIPCDVGTEVLAPEAGRIVARGKYNTGEKFMMLQIRPGTILFFTHLDEFRAKKDDQVLRGEVIALSGNTGRVIGHGHLHWEVRITSNHGANPLRSGRWFKWNPRRLRVGGDLAGLRAIVPLGGPVVPIIGDLSEPGEPPEPPDTPDPLGGPPEPIGEPVEPVEFEAEPDPDDLADAEGEDQFGDAASVLALPPLEADQESLEELQRRAALVQGPQGAP